MATNAAKYAELVAELVTYKAARLRILTGGQSASLDGMSKQQANINAINDLIAATEKSIQRLENGGRGIPIDLSVGPYAVANSESAGTEDE